MENIIAPIAKDIIIDDKNTSIIEKIIENKFTQFLNQVPELKNIKKTIANEPDFFNFSLIDTYNNTIQTIIDIINDSIKIIDNSYTNDYKSIFFSLLNIFFQENRMFYVGIILVILSFVIYFIDGATI